MSPKTHCKYGHSLTENNLLVRKDGRRNCRKCSKLRSRESQANHKKPLIDRYANIRKLFESSKHQTLFGQVLKQTSNT